MHFWQPDLDASWEKCQALAEKAKEVPAGDERARITKIADDIRDLLIKADGRIRREGNPKIFFERIDNLFNRV